MTTTELTTVRRDVALILDEMDSLAVADADQAAAAADFLTRLKTTQKLVADHFEPRRKDAYAEYQAVLKERDELTKPLETAEKAVKKMLGAYQMEQERKRREAEAEARRREEAKRREEEERRLAEAIETGKEEILERPVVVAAEAPSEPEPQKLDGISYREVWRFEIEDQFKLPRTFLQPDVRMIDDYVRREKSNGSIPGVRIYSEKVVAARGR